MKARTYAPTAADLFGVVWPRHRAKHVAQAADRPVATAKAWVQRRFRPDADTLLRMARESRELRAELVRLLGEWSVDEVAAGAGGTTDGAMAGEAGRPAGPAGLVERRVGDRRRV